MALTLQPVTFREACAFIATHHRHHRPPAGWKFGLAVASGPHVVGVVVVGRPVARRFDDDWTLEVTRCCTDGTRNACSMLYAAAWRATRALAYRRLVTYTLPSEGGASLRAAGWLLLGERGRPNATWDRPTRPRVATDLPGVKLLWEMSTQPSPQCPPQP